MKSLKKTPMKKHLSGSKTFGFGQRMGAMKGMSQSFGKRRHSDGR